MSWLICEKSFSETYKLTRHTYIHTEDKVYACDKCDKLFTVISELKEHNMCRDM